MPRAEAAIGQDHCGSQPIEPHDQRSSAGLPAPRRATFGASSLSRRRRRVDVARFAPDQLPCHRTQQIPDRPASTGLAPGAAARRTGRQGRQARGAGRRRRAEQECPKLLPLDERVLRLRRPWRGFERPRRLHWSGRCGAQASGPGACSLPGLGTWSPRSRGRGCWLFQKRLDDRRRSGRSLPGRCRCCRGRPLLGTRRRRLCLGAFARRLLRRFQSPRR